MTVRAVGQNDGNSCLNTVVKSTAAGAGTFYALKYLWPITTQEDTFNNEVMTKYCHKIANNAKVAEIQESGLKTPAQDVFVKMIESKDKAAFDTKSIAEKVKTLGGENSLNGKELRTIIRNVNENSRQLLRQWTTAYNVMLKIKRPAVPFLVAGAGAGFLAGFTHNVLKADA